MALPEVTIKLGTGGLGRPSANDDGTSGMILPGVSVGGVALNTHLGPFYGLAQAEALGLTEAYDTTNTCLVWHHIRDFYKQAGEGIKLHVMLVAKTATWADILLDTGTVAPVFLELCGGEVRLLGVSSLAATFFTAAKANCVAAQKIAELALTKHHPCSILLDGSGLLLPIDMRSVADGPNANRVSVCISQDNAYPGTVAWEDSSNIGFVLGTIAGLAVNRNIGRVRNGALDIVNPRFTDGILLSAKTSADLSGLDDKGYIFIRSIAGKAGYFFNNDHTACAIADDYSYINKGRVINKAARIVRTVYVEELLNDVEIDASTGKLSPEVCKAFQQECDSQLNINMKDEVSGVKTFVDADQDVLSTDKLEVKLKVVPRGMLKTIDVTLGFSQTL